MTSNRHNRTADDTVLDAARDCVLAVGVRRTTLTDIARRAGVSRMTLYRRWPDVHTIVRDLMTREWTALVGPPDPAAGSGPVRAQLVTALVNGVTAFRTHPLLRKILEVDPDLLLPYVLDRRGATQRRFLEVIEAGIRAGHADGTVRPGRPALQARAALLLVQSYGLSMSTMTEPDDPELDADAFTAELRIVLDRSLAP